PRSKLTIDYPSIKGRTLFLSEERPPPRNNDSKERGRRPAAARRSGERLGVSGRFLALRLFLSIRSYSKFRRKPFVLPL
ncbi:MAG: hypothetical protein II622_04365, partial [Thermoguttaceae bacterium]|nr:hypothetical protein [Thermoguttaceae bacterium]